MLKLIVLLLATLSFENAVGYSALKDARIINAFKLTQYKQQMRTNTAYKYGDINHAKVARTLVHQSNWSSVGTISTNPQLRGFPMVNIISIDDNTAEGRSSGKIHFMLTDLDFTGPDWRHSNKVTFLFTDEQKLNCKNKGQDPMEPTCARTMISGKVIEMDKESAEYPDALAAFSKRHPASVNWIKAHMFYLCELQIENIFVLDFYGGPHSVSSELYYSTEPDSKELL